MFSSFWATLLYNRQALSLSLSLPLANQSIWSVHSVNLFGPSCQAVFCRCFKLRFCKDQATQATCLCLERHIFLQLFPLHSAVSFATLRMLSLGPFQLCPLLVDLGCTFLGSRCIPCCCCAALELLRGLCILSDYVHSRECLNCPFIQKFGHISWWLNAWKEKSGDVFRGTATIKRWFERRLKSICRYVNVCPGQEQSFHRWW